MAAKTADDAPRGLDGGARRAWATAYNQGKIAYDHVTPSRYADVVVDDLFIDDGPRRRKIPKARRMPNAGNMIMLGSPPMSCVNGPWLMAIHTIDERGNLKVVDLKSKGIVALWSEKLRAVVAFPGVPIPWPTVSPLQIPRLREQYREWHDGREPMGASRVRFPNPPMPVVRPCVATVYRSDKFDDVGEFVDYIHHHDPGVYAWMGKKAIMIQGGRLELTKYGLIH